MMVVICVGLLSVGFNLGLIAAVFAQKKVNKTITKTTSHDNTTYTREFMAKAVREEVIDDYFKDAIAIKKARNEARNDQLLPSQGSGQ